jgi:hypothetical protein
MHYRNNTATIIAFVTGTYSYAFKIQELGHKNLNANFSVVARIRPCMMHNIVERMLCSQHVSKNADILLM